MKFFRLARRRRIAEMVPVLRSEELESRFNGRCLVCSSAAFGPTSRHSGYSRTRKCPRLQCGRSLRVGQIVSSSEKTFVYQAVRPRPVARHPSAWQGISKANRAGTSAKMPDTEIVFAHWCQGLRRTRIKIGDTRRSRAVTRGRVGNVEHAPRATIGVGTSSMSTRNFRPKQFSAISTGLVECLGANQLVRGAEHR